MIGAMASTYAPASSKVRATACTIAATSGSVGNPAPASTCTATRSPRTSCTDIPASVASHRNG